MFKRKPKHIIKCALNRRTGEAVHIDKAVNGLKCGCYCTVCDKDFVAVQGRSFNHREWHFRHEGDRDNTSNCPGGVESALHKLAKHIMVTSSSIDLPKFGTITYSDPVAEIKHQSTRPDVTVIYKGEPAYFEIAVHHFIEPHKEEFFLSGQYRSVEIDLSRLDPLASFEHIQEAVLRNTYNKHVIFWEPDPPEIQPPVARPAFVVQPKEDGFDKILRFIKERPRESLLIVVGCIVILPRAIRWIWKKIFWFLYPKK